jgi:predicted RNase H-like HicB family nuclease
MSVKKNLSEEMRENAEILASHPYSVTIIQDVTDDGKIIFFAKNPELDGCMSHGRTSEEAINNLREARVDYIQVCLLSGISIPEPFTNQIMTSGTFVSIVYNNSSYITNQIDMMGGNTQFEHSNTNPQFVFEQFVPC